MGALFARQVEAFGAPADATLGISIGGNSLNLLGGIRAAHKVGMLRVAFTGKVGEKAFKMATPYLRVPRAVSR